MISTEEKSVLLNNAIINYIFEYCFSKKNNGKVFDAQAWSDAIDEVAKNLIFPMSEQTMVNFEKVTTNLDLYAKDDPNSLITQN